MRHRPGYQGVPASPLSLADCEGSYTETCILYHSDRERCRFRMGKSRILVQSSKWLRHDRFNDRNCISASFEDEMYLTAGVKLRTGEREPGKHSFVLNNISTPK